MEKSHPLVSIIIPNYNYARYLKERMDSILNQTFRDFEIILLDDASTDDSVEIINKYKSHPQVTAIVINKENTGSPFKQWWKGIQMARGKYIWIAETDDVADLSFLEQTVTLAEKYPDTSICHVGFKMMDSESNVITKDFNKFGKRRIKKGYAYFKGTEYAKRNLYWGSYIRNASGVIFRREYTTRLASSSFVEMRYSGDWLFWFEMSMLGGVIEIYKELNFFRQHGKSVTDSGKINAKGVQEDIKIVKHIENIFPDFSAYKKCIRGALFYKHISRMPHNYSKRKELLDFLKKELNIDKKDYIIERINKFLGTICPFLISKNRERL